MQNKIQNINLCIEKTSVKSVLYDDFYFNSLDPIAESEYVYLKGNNLLKRFKNSNNFVLTELGFGSGLNFLLVWNLWKSLRKNNSILNYISFEKNPLSKHQMEKIFKTLNKLDHLSSILIEKLPSLHSGVHEIDFDKGSVRLTLIYEEFIFLKNFSFYSDAWFLDGFSPSKNKSAWDKSIIKKIYNNTKVNGTFSTFTASSEVQTKLIESGFTINKKNGFGKKREMLVGIKKEKKNINSFSSNNFKNIIEPVAIIGSGISGASVAYFLKRRNIDCFILEKKKDFANGASGNRVALQLPRLTLDNSIQGVFSLASFNFSRKLSINLNCSPMTDGVIVSPSRVREIMKFKKLIKYNWPKDLFHEYNGKFKIDKNIIAHKFPSSGIVDNKKFINELSLNVERINNFEVKEILDENNKKLLISKNGKCVKAKTVIWANGFEMKERLKNNLIIPVSGQVTYLNETNLSKKIKLNFSYGKFISQSFHGVHQIGSTFDRKKFIASKLNDFENLRNLPDYFFQIFELTSNMDFKSRSSIRASTKNRLPFLGTIFENNEYFLGGMGSWGFIYAPFLAEILIKKILNEPILLDDRVQNALNIQNYIS